MVNIIHSVLDTPYLILFGKKKEIGLRKDHMGLCRVFAKEILVFDGKDDCTEEERKVRVQETVAHELFHAYLNEAGIDLDPDDEERLACFYMKNWEKLHGSIEYVLEVAGFLDK